MKSSPAIKLAHVQETYSGPEAKLWELLMGEQIHIGGLASSLDLAEQAGIAEGSRGVDLCCCTGAGMRVLARFRKVAGMTGVDATPAMIQLGQRRCAEEGSGARIAFVEADVCATGLPAGQADFAWGEDAWCYVENKPQLIAEAARLVKAGGVIAFTDWMEGPAGLSASEAERFLKFMKFPNLLSLEEYKSTLQASGCTVQKAQDTGRFSSHCQLYLDMTEKQLTYDALKIIGWDMALAQAILAEMHFMLCLAQSGKIMQGLIVAQKK